MSLDSIESRMRVHERATDHHILPGLYVVARLDGKGFTKLTDPNHFEKPFDNRFHQAMVDTTRQLMDCGFRVLLGYTQSDEISLLFHPEDDAFSRNTRKWLSILAGEASACFSLGVGRMGVFDCRLSLFPRRDQLLEYFSWRQGDATRNALSAWCYWTLINKGSSAQTATQQLKGMSGSAKQELLHQHNINFNDLPAWQKRGTCLYWETWSKPGFNPKTQEREKAIRRRLTTNSEPPYGQAFPELVLRCLPSEETVD